MEGGNLSLSLCRDKINLCLKKYLISYEWCDNRYLQYIHKVHIWIIDPIKALTVVVTWRWNTRKVNIQISMTMREILITWTNFSEFDSCFEGVTVLPHFEHLQSAHWQLRQEQRSRTIDLAHVQLFEHSLFWPQPPSSHLQGLQMHFSPQHWHVVLSILVLLGMFS